MSRKDGNFVEVRIEHEADIPALLNSISGSHLGKTVAAALNKTLNEVKILSRKNLISTVRLKVEKASKAMRGKRAGGPASDANMQAVLQIKSQPVALFEYHPDVLDVMSRRGRRIGASVDVKGKRKLVKGGFQAKMKSGHVGIFIRSEINPKTKSLGKSGIDELFATRVIDVFSGDQFMSGIESEASKALGLNIEAALKKY